MAIPTRRPASQPVLDLAADGRPLRLLGIAWCERRSGHHRAIDFGGDLGGRGMGLRRGGRTARELGDALSEDGDPSEAAGGDEGEGRHGVQAACAGVEQL